MRKSSSSLFFLFGQDVLFAPFFPPNSTLATDFSDCFLFLVRGRRIASSVESDLLLLARFLRLIPHFPKEGLVGQNGR